MIDLTSKQEIDKISYDLLKQSKSIDIFPTPVDQILRYSNLRLNDGVDLSSVDQGFLSRISEKMGQKLMETLTSIRGFIDRSEKLIYLDLTQHINRQNFVKLHELGHDALTWQNEILQYLDDDQTLSADTKEEFEAEANYFASATLFQHDRFEHEMSKLELGIKSPMYLAKHFGSSNHAALRRYVEYSKKRCALLVLKDVTLIGTEPKCFKRNFFQSRAFEQTYGHVILPDEFGYTWSFTREYYHKKKYHEKGEITLTTQNGEVKFQYHFFNNTYNAFVFLFPPGEKIKTRTRFIINS